MLDLTACEPSLLYLADTVVTELLVRSTQLRPDDLLLVGANCRDILQRALGHEFELRTTVDVDLGLAIANWEAYDELTEELPTAGNTGIRYSVAGVPADLMPFGPVEQPPGTVIPATRREPMSVWGFTEVFDASLALPLPGGTTIRIPTVAGYAALKLVAWLDRSAYGEYKDASDIATALYWYAKSPAVAAHLFDSDQGQRVLLQEDMDDSVAAARILGEDVARTIGHTRLSELADRWPGKQADLLYHSMTVPNATGWPASAERRQAFVQAMERGMGLPQAD
ncbi:hypothetical protein COUCH_12560 [Couchioplanes caeruleus]|uniref:hypothetical protein n=1 Tax=Couchioplanes caeruleus TaxID=56438 RepID=UPI0020C16BF4|nr:hypothetical protein [Couchioplanes caeruleus]UQU67047.1 hypothetical protein COUCH_12560 [Couchioplanes caeruleus]